MKHTQEKLESKIQELSNEHQQVDAGEDKDGVIESEGHIQAGSPPERSRPDDVQSTEPLMPGNAPDKPLSRKSGRSKKRKHAERLQRLRRQSACITEWFGSHEKKIGRQGKELKSNITDDDREDRYG